MHLVFYLLLCGLGGSLGFSINSAEVLKDGFVEGGDLELMCTVDEYYEYCTFTSMASKEFCDFAWDDNDYAMKMVNCTAFAGRAELIGKYNQYQCGLRIKNATLKEAGQWACDMENYYSGYYRGYGYQKQKTMSVNILPLPTTTTTTTTTTSTTTTTTSTSTTTTTSETDLPDVFDDYEKDEDDYSELPDGSAAPQESDVPPKKEEGGDSPSPALFIIIAVVVLLVAAGLLLLFLFLRCKNRLPPLLRGQKGDKRLKPVGTSLEEPEGLDDDESKHPSILKSNGAATTEAPEEKLESVTYTVEGEKDEQQPPTSAPATDKEDPEKEPLKPQPEKEEP